MKSIVHTYSHAFAEELGIELIPMGIETVEAATPDEVLALLKKDESVQILMSESVEAPYLQNVRETRPAVHIFLLAHQNLKPGDLKALGPAGITSVIAYSENVANIAEEFVKTILRNNIRTTERRAHVRVQPRDVENVKAAVLIRDLSGDRHRFIQGSVLDISAGGVAIRLDDLREAGALKLKTVYDPVVIVMKGMQIKTVSRLMGRRDNIAGFKFENVEPADMRKIASYIHGKVSECTRKFTDKV